MNIYYVLIPEYIRLLLWKRHDGEKISLYVALYFVHLRIDPIDRLA